MEGRLLSNQSEQFEKFSKCPDSKKPEKKPALQKSHFCFDHVNRLMIVLNSVMCYEIIFIKLTAWNLMKYCFTFDLNLGNESVLL